MPRYRRTIRSRGHLNEHLDGDELSLLTGGWTPGPPEDPVATGGSGLIAFAITFADRMPAAQSR